MSSASVLGVGVWRTEIPDVQSPVVWSTTPLNQRIVRRISSSQCVSVGGLRETGTSPSSVAYGTSLFGRDIGCIRQSIDLCYKQCWYCVCAVSAPSWVVAMLSIQWGMLLVIYMWHACRAWPLSYARGGCLWCKMWSV